MIIYNKLVRDKIPQIIEAKGKIAEVRIMDSDEYAKMLYAKLQEELNEFLEGNENDQLEELADLVEVVYAILESKGVNIDDFEKVRLKKKETKGGFKDRLLLLSVSSNSENELDKLEFKALHLVHYIRSLSNFNIELEFDGSYDHMGATITDAILQAGLKYETVVKPKVIHIKNTYPEAITISGFLSLIERIPVATLLQKKNGESFKGVKPSLILEVTQFFKREGIETENDLKNWLQTESNLLSLRHINGIGDKTVDYFKILVGIETSAVDRHLMNFVKEASILVASYKECQDIINKAAEIMNINKSIFDHSIWAYMSER